MALSDWRCWLKLIEINEFVRLGEPFAFLICEVESINKKFVRPADKRAKMSPWQTQITVTERIWVTNQE